jgi:hypothetical protein
MNIPMVKVPTFSMTLPVSKEKIDFRPFLVKEEKLLILANEASDTESALKAIGEVVESCTNGKVQLHKHCLADMQYAFLQIRGKSVGPEINFYLICGDCGHRHLSTISVEDFDIKLPKKLETVFAIDGDIRVEMKFPGLAHYTKLFDEQTDEAVFDVVADCIVKIFNDEEVFENTKDTKNEVRVFLDNLTPEQFEKFEDFFVNMPVLYKELSFTCTSCSKQNSLIVDSIQNFFE